MDKRTIIAILLVAIAWMGYFILTKPDVQEKKPDAIQNEEASKKTEVDKTAKDRQIKLEAINAGGKENQIKIKTKKFAFTLSNRGAVISGATYLERNIDLIVDKNPYSSKGVLDFTVHFDENEFLGGNRLSDAIWTYRHEGGNRISFFIDAKINDSPVRIEKTYIFPDDGYGFKVEYRFRNLGGRSIALKNAGLIVSPGDMLGPALNYSNTYNKLSGIYSLNGDFKQSSKGGGSSFLPGCGSSSSGGPLKKETGTVNWVGIMSRYFLVIMIPEEFSGSAALEDNRATSGYRTGIQVPISALEPGKEVKKSFKVYLGEKDKTHLASVDKSTIDAADVNKIIEPIRNFVIWILLYINKYIGNLGWSLVLFSLLSKVVFMPLTIKSNESMKKMQQLTPKLNELKVKFKDKPDMLQKEMMKLYKENKVNPMGGCFPLLLQMPFFFALYSALINSIDLWKAPFIFWMKDLSMPDTVLTVSGFDLNILPILMTATTFVQQKLSTVEAAGQQKMLMMFMPLMFIFIFWSMPSGLVLYWALQNVFQILQQVYINYRAKAKKD
jgi:YidC/Oxa1 family membrane protein insertase